jgi:hypothetical protein
MTFPISCQSENERDRNTDTVNAHCQDRCHIRAQYFQCCIHVKTIDYVSEITHGRFAIRYVPSIWIFTSNEKAMISPVLALLGSHAVSRRMHHERLLESSRFPFVGLKHHKLLRSVKTFSISFRWGSISDPNLWKASDLPTYPFEKRTDQIFPAVEDGNRNEIRMLQVIDRWIRKVFHRASHFKFNSLCHNRIPSWMTIDLSHVNQNHLSLNLGSLFGQFCHFGEHVIWFLPPAYRRKWHPCPQKRSIRLRYHQKILSLASESFDKLLGIQFHFLEWKLIWEGYLPALPQIHNFRLQMQEISEKYFRSGKEMLGRITNIQPPVALSNKPG